MGDFSCVSLLNISGITQARPACQGNKRDKGEKRGSSVTLSLGDISHVVSVVVGAHGQSPRSQQGPLSGPRAHIPGCRGLHWALGRVGEPPPGRTLARPHSSLLHTALQEQPGEGSVRVLPGGHQRDRLQVWKPHNSTHHQPRNPVQCHSACRWLGRHSGRQG